MKFTLVLGHLPPSELFPNKLRTIHWSKRAAIEATSRLEAYYTALEAPQRPRFKKAIANYTFFVNDKRRRDVESLVSASKPYVDGGFVDTGILPDDDCWHLSIGFAKVQCGEYKTMIELVEEK